VENLENDLGGHCFRGGRTKDGNPMPDKFGGLDKQFPRAMRGANNKAPHLAEEFRLMIERHMASAVLAA